jgi:hypothetical protein
VIVVENGERPRSRLTDAVSLGVLARWVPRDEIDTAVAVTGRQARRRDGKLPPHVMVYFTMAMALFADDDYEEVLARLTDTLAAWPDCWDSAWETPPSCRRSCLTTGTHPSWRRSSMVTSPPRAKSSKTTWPPPPSSTPGRRPPHRHAATGEFREAHRAHTRDRGSRQDADNTRQVEAGGRSRRPAAHHRV